MKLSLSSRHYEYETPPLSVPGAGREAVAEAGGRLPPLLPRRQDGRGEPQATR